MRHKSIALRYKMRPALQRLLARPSSLELLRYAVGQAPEFSPRNAKLPIRLYRSCWRHNSNAAAVIKQFTASESQGTGNTGWEGPPPVPFVNEQMLRKLNIMSELTNTGQRYSTFDYGPWKESSWTRDEIEFQSNLHEEGPRLLDDPSNRTDLRLWACLFDYRRRIHGADGVRMFWDAAKRGDFQIPVEGAYAPLFWEEFVKLGLQDQEVLNEVAELGNRTLESTDKRWPGLYNKVIQHMLLNGRGEEAAEWHIRFFQIHTPAPEAFAEMICQVILRQGDTKFLKEIYETSSHRNIYGMVVPFLCEVEDFESAYLWHWTFVRSGDLPTTSKTAEPLVHFMSIYYKQRAVKLTASLVDAGVPFAWRITSMSDEKVELSRELMNLMHGETFNTPPITYSDKIGARWLATRWVSLDVAMTAISALGVKDIGPLSLQAIALREEEAEGITHRLNQLRDLDIGIGKSVFSKSVAKFARSGNQQFLDCLLRSDHHPDALEDPKLLEQLLVSYDKSNDTLRYRMAMAMRLIRSESPEVDSKNILLRKYAKTADTAALLASIREMNMAGETVTVHTVKTILKNVLRPRRPAHRPVVSHTTKGDDLKMAINILKSLMQSGSFVPATYWVEIIKRIGMGGRWKDLEELCIFLASWYGPANRDRVPATAKGKRVHRYRIPAQVGSGHLLHPLRILFPPQLQRSIVEWGFMHALRPRAAKSSRSQGLVHNVKASPDVACAIQLLKKLRQYDVHIDLMSVRKAIFDRFIVYYGPGESQKAYNQQARENNVLSLDEMIEKMNEALGMQMFQGPEVRDTIEKRGHARIRRAEVKELLALRSPFRNHSTEEND